MRKQSPAAMAAVTLWVTFGGTCSCDLVLGVAADRADAPCDEGERRCNEGLRQRCTGELAWADDPCANPAPVCSNGACVAVESIAVGASHTCVVLSDHTVQCWGLNDEGQLGRETAVGNDPENVNFEATPAPVTGLIGVRKVAIGGSQDGGHSCAVLEDGHVACWGRNNSFQLGDGTREPRFQHRVVDGLTDVEDLALGYERSCALRKDRTVWCWGLNLFGSLIPGNDELWIAAPVKLSMLEDIVQLGLGARHACALAASGVVNCWGSNLVGQVADPASNKQGAVAPTPIDSLHAERIAAGDYHSCAITSSHEVHCWGRNQCGQLGRGEVCVGAAGSCSGAVGEHESESCGEVEPAPCIALSGKPLLASGVSLGSHHACLISNGGSVFCWGRNDYLQIGLDSEFLAHTDYTDRALDRVVEHAVSLDVGSYHGCALHEAGDVWCWGRNDVGQLGRGVASLKEKAAAVVWHLPSL